MDMSAYVIAKLLPAPVARFQELAAACTDPEQARYALAELNTWLSGLSAPELAEAVSQPPPRLAPYFANYVAAMTELACARRKVAAPSWTQTIAPLVDPVFGSTLMSLRLYLLTHSPAPFRRRNIFIDSSIDSRV